MILFDLDGTLWDSAENVAASWNIIVDKRKADRPELLLRHFSADDIHSVMGKPMTEIADILFSGLSEELKSEIAGECMEYEVEYIAGHGGKLFPGVRDTLEKLSRTGRKMAIVSNCQSGYILAFLDSMDMRKYFCDYEEWGNTKLSKGNNIKLVLERNGAKSESSVYVGDTAGDMAASKEAGIRFILAGYGFGDAPGADARLAGFEQLPELLEKFEI